MLKDKRYERKRKTLQYTHWCKESKEYRKIWNRKYRASVRTSLAFGDFENVPIYKASGGFLTW